MGVYVFWIIRLSDSLGQGSRRQLAVLVCLGLWGLPGHRTLSEETVKAPGKPGEVGHSAKV